MSDALGHKPRVRGNVVMTDDDLDRLPPNFEEIVRHGRTLTKVLGATVIEMDLAKNMIQRARDLRRGAELYCWGDHKKPRKS